MLCFVTPVSRSGDGPMVGGPTCAEPAARLTQQAHLAYHAQCGLGIFERQRALTWCSPPRCSSSSCTILLIVTRNACLGDQGSHCNLAPTVIWHQREKQATGKSTEGAVPHIVSQDHVCGDQGVHPTCAAAQNLSQSQEVTSTRLRAAQIVKHNGSERGVLNAPPRMPW